MVKTKILAHRGYPIGSIVENTMSAFKSAFDLGCEGIELDVHMSKDKEWIVHHDSTLDGLNITQSSSRALKNKASKLNYELATLNEVLEKYPKKIINVEAKQDSFHVGKLLGKFLEEHGIRENHYVTSFKSKTLTGVRKSSETIHLGWITAFANTKKWKYLHQRIRLYTINPLHYILNQQKIFEISKNKIKIQPWTINREGSIQKFLKYDIDAIITDKPELALFERSKLLK